MVKEDGSEMVVYLDDTLERDKEMAYYVNTTDGSYTYKKFESFDKIAPYGDPRKYSGGTIEEITYTSGIHTYELFKDWEFE